MNYTRVMWLLAPVLLVAALSAGWTDPAAAPAPGTDVLRVLPDVLGWVGPAAPPAPTELQIKNGDQIAFMGDSTMQAGGFLRLMQYVLKTQYPQLKVTLLNASLGGNITTPMMQQHLVQDAKLGAGTTWLFINPGMGEAGSALDPAPLAAAVAKMVDEGRAAGAQVVLLTPTIFSDDPNHWINNGLPKYVAVVQQVAAEKNCPLVDLHAMFLAVIAAKPAGLPLTADTRSRMDVYGDAIMAVAVLRALGVPDATIAATDPLPILQVTRWYISLDAAAKLIGIPPSRFSKPELVRYVGF